MENEPAGIPAGESVVITENWQDRHRSVQNSHALRMGRDWPLKPTIRTESLHLAVDAAKTSNIRPTTAHCGGPLGQGLHRSSVARGILTHPWGKKSRTSEFRQVFRFGSVATQKCNGNYQYKDQQTQQTKFNHRRVENGA